MKTTVLALCGISLFAASLQAATIYSNTASYTWNLENTTDPPVAGNSVVVNGPVSTLSAPFSNGDTTAFFQGNIDATGGGPNLSVTHQNDGNVPNNPGFPTGNIPHRVRTTLTQNIEFIAGPGETLSFAGTIIANPASGTPGTAQASFTVYNITAAMPVAGFPVSLTNGQISGSTFPSISLVDGNAYRVSYTTDNDKESTSATFGGSINSGGTLTYALSGGTWSYDATVPEPSSALLLGLAGLGFVLRRRG